MARNIGAITFCAARLMWVWKKFVARETTFSSANQTLETSV